MAIPWLVVLQNVPWTDVIRNAPKVAEGAKKLWNSIGKKGGEPESSAPADEADATAEEQVIEQLQSRLGRLEQTTVALHEQMLASSELINALAEQNAQLVKRIETNRVQLRWMLFGLVMAVILSAFGLYFVR